MIAKLRRKFIRITMYSVVLVLVIIMGGLNLANYLHFDSSTAHTLDLVLSNNGRFPADGQFGDAEGAGGPKPGELSEEAEVPPADQGPEVNSKGFFAFRSFFKDAVRGGDRVFVARIDAKGKVVEVTDAMYGSAADKEYEKTLKDMAATLYAEESTGGYKGSWKYRSLTGANETLYVFADCQRFLDSFHNFLILSIFISLAGIFFIFILVVLLSKHAIRPISEAYDKQKQFVTNAGHEIKTPLSVIETCTDVIELDTGESKWTQGIHEQVQRLNKLTQGLVSLAKMDEGSSRPEMSDFDLSGAVYDSLEPFSLIAEKKGLHFEMEIDEGIVLYGNEKSIRQLVSILADNAIKYTSAGGAIHFALHRMGRHIVLEGRNTTEGLISGKQNQMFERFYRGDASRSSQTKGYGLGLSIAQMIVGAHGGKIEAESHENDMFVITVTI